MEHGEGGMERWEGEWKGAEMGEKRGKVLERLELGRGMRLCLAGKGRIKKIGGTNARGKNRGEPR
jgi:hypothetical protein